MARARTHTGVILFDDGGAVGRVDEFPTAEAFLEAYRQAAMLPPEDTEGVEIHRTWARWTPNPPGGLGGYDIYLRYNAKPGRGAFEIWAIEV